MKIFPIETKRTNKIKWESKCKSIISIKSIGYYHYYNLLPLANRCGEEPRKEKKAYLFPIKEIKKKIE